MIHSVVGAPNLALRLAREGTPSSVTPGESMSRRELAEAVSAWVKRHTGRTVALDGNYIGKLERGIIQRPQTEYRAALREILNVPTDHALGFAVYGAVAAPEATRPHVVDVRDTVSAAESWGRRRPAGHRAPGPQTPPGGIGREGIGREQIDQDQIGGPAFAGQVFGGPAFDDAAYDGPAAGGPAYGGSAYGGTESPDAVPGGPGEGRPADGGAAGEGSSWPTNGLDARMEPLASASAEFGAWAEGFARAGDVVAMVHRDVNALSAAALVDPPAEVLPRAAALTGRVFALARSKLRPGDARDVWSAAARVCALLAWLCGDVGRLHAAVLHLRAARACADLADEPETTAWTLAVRSKIAFLSGELRVAAELARQGASLEAPGTAPVMLACLAADALSVAGAGPQTLAALLRAERLAGEVQGDDGIGGLFSCPPLRHANYLGSALLAVGDSAGALEASQSALRLVRETPGIGFGTVAQVHLTLAAAHAQTGDVTSADAAARHVLDLPVSRRLATFAPRIEQIVGALTRPGVGPTARGLVAELEEYRRGLPRGRTVVPRQEAAR